MNTKTMRLPPRRVPDSIPNNKRKERDGFDLKQLNPPPPPTKPPMLAAHALLSNQLLAGYLAHEFLTRGTLLGQPWDPTRPQPNDESRREKAESAERSIADDAESDPEPDPKRQRYVEVASLLKSDGAHVPGIVNPSQLSRFLEK